MQKFPLPNQDWVHDLAHRENAIISAHLDENNELVIGNLPWTHKDDLIGESWHGRKDELERIEKSLTNRYNNTPQLQKKAEQENEIISRILMLTEGLRRNVNSIVIEVGNLSGRDRKSIYNGIMNIGVDNILASDDFIYGVDIIGDRNPVLYPTYLKFQELYPEFYDSLESENADERKVIIMLFAYIIKNNKEMLKAFSEGTGGILSEIEVYSELEYLSDNELREFGAGLLNH